MDLPDHRRGGSLGWAGHFIPFAVVLMQRDEDVEALCDAWKQKDPAKRVPGEPSWVLREALGRSVDLRTSLRHNETPGQPELEDRLKIEPLDPALLPLTIAPTYKRGKKLTTLSKGFGDDAGGNDDEAEAGATAADTVPGDAAPPKKK